LAEKGGKMKQYYENHEDNAAFMRCVDLLAELIEKYADRILNAAFYGDYVVNVMGVQMIIEVVPAVYEEDLLSDYYNRAYYSDIVKAA